MFRAVISRDATADGRLPVTLMVKRDDRWCVCGVLTVIPGEWAQLRTGLEETLNIEVIDARVPIDAPETAQAL